jgi:hypothetical protein
MYVYKELEDGNERSYNTPAAFLEYFMAGA